MYSAAQRRLVRLFPEAVAVLAGGCRECHAAEAIWHGSQLIVHGPTCPGAEARVGAPVHRDNDNEGRQQ